MRPARVCIGVIAGAHGVRGEVKVKTFTADPAAVAAYGPVADESGGRAFELSLRGTATLASPASATGTRRRRSRVPSSMWTATSCRSPRVTSSITPT